MKDNLQCSLRTCSSRRSPREPFHNTLCMFLVKFWRTSPSLRFSTYFLVRSSLSFIVFVPVKYLESKSDERGNLGTFSSISRQFSCRTNGVSLDVFPRFEKGCDPSEWIESRPCWKDGSGKRGAHAYRRGFRCLFNRRQKSPTLIRGSSRIFKLPVSERNGTDSVATRMEKRKFEAS